MNDAQQARGHRTPSGTICVAVTLALCVFACSSNPGPAVGSETGGGSGQVTGGTTGSGGTSNGAGGTTVSGGATGSGGQGTIGSGGSPGSGGARGSCAGTLMLCGGSCVDTMGSQTNCGGCGKPCRAEQTCWQGACKCPTGQADCGGTCKDILSSTVNCGACNMACAMGASCVSGQCTCPNGGVPCNGACTDTNTDPKNCGGCNKPACGSGTKCLFGACLDPNSLTCTPKAQGNKMSNNGDYVTLGKYWINNNQWGAHNGSGSQSIWSTCQQGDLVGWGTSWNWTGTANVVKSFASSVLGWQFGWKLTGGGLPVQISSGRSINCGWSFSLMQSGGSADVAYDIFAHSQAMPGSNDNPTDEIMIWLYAANGAGPIGIKQTTVTIDGTTWDLYRGLTRWNVFSYVRTTNATTAVIDIMNFMKDLVARGWMQGSKYITSVQSGTEVFTGTGQLDTNGYYCRVQ